MSCCELDLALLIPKKGTEDDEETKVEPYLRYKGTAYKKTLRVKIPSWQPVKSKLKRFYNWLGFVWCHSRARKCRKLTFLALFLILLTSFLVIFVLFPLAFKYSTAFQQHTVFHPTINTHESYSAAIQFKKDYSVMTFYKPKNLYVVVDKAFNISLGLWSLNPQIVKTTTRFWNSHKQKYETKVEEREAPYLLYFHDFTGDRRTYIDVYNLLLRNFHVIAFDYRGFGDSTQDVLTESKMVNDGVNLYKWLRENTNSSIYVWGDRLGAVVAAWTVEKLQSEKIEPSGLILENPSLSMSDYLVQNWFIAKMVSHMLWFKQTIVDPLAESDLSFVIMDSILQINCPIVFCLYRTNQNKFDAYINENNYDVSRKHVRIKADVQYYFRYQSDLSAFDTWIRNFITNNKYLENQSKE